MANRQFLALKFYVRVVVGEPFKEMFNMFGWSKKKTWSQEKCGTNEPPKKAPSHKSNFPPTAERLIKQSSTLEEIQETVNTLVRIANGEKVFLTQRQAYLAVRTMDLTEGYIARVDFSDGKWDKYKAEYQQ